MSELIGSPVRVALAMLGIAAIVWGWRQLRLRAAPARPMRTLQGGRPVTEPAAKLALARQQGWVAIVFGLALLIGPQLGRDRADADAGAPEREA